MSRDLCNLKGAKKAYHWCLALLWSSPHTVKYPLVHSSGHPAQNVQQLIHFTNLERSSPTILSRRFTSKYVALVHNIASNHCGWNQHRCTQSPTLERKGWCKYWSDRHGGEFSRVIWGDRWRRWDAQALGRCVRCGDGCNGHRHQSSSEVLEPGILHSHQILLRLLQRTALAPDSHSTSAQNNEDGIKLFTTWALVSPNFDKSGSPL